MGRMLFEDPVQRPDAPTSVAQAKMRVSRRIWLRSIALVTMSSVLPSVAGTAVGAPDETKKVAKDAVHYQNRPDAGKMCGMCRYVIPAGGVAGHGMMGGMMGPGMMGPGMMAEGSCQVVEGRISPMGYCILYTPV